MQKYLLIIMISLCAWTTQAQQTVKGTVESPTGILAGASVFEKDVPTSGVVTDNRGEFTISIKGKGILVVQSIGYLSKEVDVAGRNQVTVTLSIDAKGLEDVVVVGYGRQRKIASTAAVSAIKGEELRQTPTASFQNALIGRVPGIVSQQRSGRPGQDGSRILIRGLSSMGGGDNAGAPLIILDDLEYTGDLGDIDADQIENFTILKDAASTAVFGIKGANGVIVITTRRGKTGRPRITFRTENAAQRPTYLPKYLDSWQSALLRNQALASDNKPPEWTEDDLQKFKDGSDPNGHPNVDWADVLLRKYSLQSYNNLNISGGTDRAKYFVSAGYLWQSGMVKDFTSDKDLNSNYYFRRYNFRSNLDFNASKTLTLNLDMSGSLSERNEPWIKGRNDRNNVFFEISDYNQLPPFAYNLYNPDGSYGSNPANTNYSNNAIGRLALGGYRRFFDNTIGINARANQKLDFITRGLSARFILGYAGQLEFHRHLRRPDVQFPSFRYNTVDGTYTTFNPNVTRPEKLVMEYGPDNSFKRLNWQGSVNYDRNFNGHHAYALGLFSQTSNLDDAEIPYYLRGFSFRAGYDYKSRYLLELNAGYNGSSRFSSAKRYDWFPAVSVGWNLAEEPFFQKALPWVDLFKIRGSTGLTGTDELGAVGGTTYIYLPNYIRSGSYSIGDIHTNISGIVEDRLGNDVTWEKEQQWDVGVDLRLLNGKLTITADYFDRFRYDILITRASVSNILGINLPPVNLGKTQNRGFEIELGYADQAGGFSYSAKANISVAKNKVIFMDEANPAFPWLARTGQQMGTIPGFQFLGYYQDSADIAKSAKPAGLTPKPGDLKYADLNGDGILDDNDKRIMEYPNLPNTILGFTGFASYKNFSLSFTLQSALQFANRKIAESINPFGNNMRAIHAGAWTPTNNVNPSFPRLGVDANINNAGTYPSDYWFRRTDYLRIKTMQLSYDFGRKFTSRLRLQGAKIYMSGYNLFTWMLKDENIYEVDPETPSGTEGGDYPVQRVYNFGIQVSF